MLHIMLREWREAAASAILYLLACLTAGRALAPHVPSLDNARSAVAALLSLGLIALSAARPFAGERALGTLEFTASLPVGRGRLFITKVAAALLFALLGVFAVAACFKVTVTDLASCRPNLPPSEMFMPATPLCIASGLLLFASVLFATVAGLGEFAALGVGSLIWGALAGLSNGLRVLGVYNPILANLLPALGLLAASWHLFARGEPFDGSRRGRDLARAALVLPATIAALHLLASITSPAATESDLAGRAVIANVQADRTRGPASFFSVTLSCSLDTRIPWWSPFSDGYGIERRTGWIDLTSREVRLIPGRHLGSIHLSPDRKRAVYLAGDDRFGHPIQDRCRVMLHDAVTGRSTLLSENHFLADEDDLPPIAAGVSLQDGIDVHWRPDGTRVALVEPGRSRRWRVTLLEIPSTRPTRSFEMGEEPLSTPFWGKSPDAIAFVSVDRLAGHVNTALEPDADGRLVDPFAGSLARGERIEAFAVAGEWILGCGRGAADRFLLAHEIGRSGAHRHPLPAEYRLELTDAVALEFVPGGPGDALFGLYIERTGGAGGDVRLVRREFDLARGVQKVHESWAAEATVVAEGSPRLLGLKRAGGSGRSTLWLRVSAPGLALVPMNFVRADDSLSVTEWPEWLEKAHLLDGVAYHADDEGVLHTLELPAPGNTFAAERAYSLLPCPKCGR